MGNLDEIFNYSKKNYIITYKDLLNKEKVTSGDAYSKYDAEQQFRKNFNPWCEIIKVQTSDEWINETTSEIVQGMMKHIKKDLKSIINPKNTKNIDYNSKTFKKGLKKVNDLAEKSREMSFLDNEKKHLSYNC